MTNQEWRTLSTVLTNGDGRASGFLDGEDFSEGVYRLHFSTEKYFRQEGRDTFYPFVEVVFRVANGTEHYHVPLLLNPFGYTTYRGS